MAAVVRTDSCGKKSLWKGRSYNDRNPLERQFIELSRREEIWQTRRDQERSLLYRLAAVLLGIGTIVFGLIAYQWYQNWRLAVSETARAEHGLNVLRDKHKLTLRFEVARALTDIGKTLAGIGTGSIADRKIAFQRLDALRDLLSDDLEVKQLLADERLTALRPYRGGIGGGHKGARIPDPGAGDSAEGSSSESRDRGP